MKLLLALLLAGVIASGIGVVYARHQSRALFVQLQSLLSERDALNIEWGQLQLESRAPWPPMAGSSDWQPSGWRCMCRPTTKSSW